MQDRNDLQVGQFVFITCISRRSWIGGVVIRIAPTNDLRPGVDFGSLNGVTCCEVEFWEGDTEVYCQDDLIPAHELYSGEQIYQLGEKVFVRDQKNSHNSPGGWLVGCIMEIQIGRLEDETGIVEPGVYLVRVPFEDYQDVWYSPARLFPAELFARNTQQIQQFDYHRTLPSWELTDEDRELLTLLEESRFEITYPVDSPFKMLQRVIAKRLDSQGNKPWKAGVVVSIRPVPECAKHPVLYEIRWSTGCSSFLPPEDIKPISKAAELRNTLINKPAFLNGLGVFTKHGTRTGLRRWEQRSPRV